ncbi:chromatin-remodeling ATPase INO80-like [Telopea speciosissima]|uniref:chromatin-remodeling ATPase INO80-like n=1 Tax=Telopea speciosissima TaxID=54955 RepID=UPI001CC36E87|nr:chromatin-remodeling ATPase INO80-like [Telopea speciosissima]
MDTNGIPGGLFPGMASGMLGLEMPLHQQQHKHQQMVNFPTHDTDHHSQSPQTAVKQQVYPYNTKGKQQQQTTWSDEDEPGFAGEAGGGDAKKRTSPWHRMKWTDNMVKLLIMVVFYIGDDGGGEVTDPSTNGKKKSGGLLQKKGKWKSVSRAMMEKGFYVSPQQCEDKFNDLNKRYKRVNDILGKGTACKVVENQSLLDTMENLSLKMKEEVRKLLNSKHLFFREMCAYHNSCAGGGGAGAAAAAACHQSAEVSVDSTHHSPNQRCLHSSENNSVLAGSRSGADTQGLKVDRGGIREEEGDDEDEDDGDDDDDDDDDDEEEEEMENGRGQKSHNEYRGGEEEELGSKKRARRGMLMLSSSTSPPPSSPTSLSPAMQQLSSELMSVVQDGTKSKWEQRQWVRSKSLQLEEQKVSYQYEAFELEKQRLKWIKFSGKKEREMERMKLENERMRLENEKMVLLLRHKELELIDLQQHQLSSNRRPDPSSITG